MKEEILKDFFIGSIDSEALSSDLDGSVQIKNMIARHSIEDMNEDFEVKASHLVKLCDAILNSSLNVEYLKLIGFALIASDQFEWDADTNLGGRVAEVLHDWSCPDVNYPLTLDNVRQWKIFLLTGVKNLSAL